MIGFGGNYRNPVVASFTNMPCGSDSGNPISNNDNMFHKVVLNVRAIKSASRNKLSSHNISYRTKFNCHIFDSTCEPSEGLLLLKNQVTFEYGRGVNKIAQKTDQ